MSRVLGRWIRAAALIAVGLLASCATPPADPVARAEFDRTNDPLEPLNRKTFAFNQFVDHALLRPVAKGYVAVVPDDARRAIHHVLDNMKEPTLFFNNVLQGEFERAWITLGRFAVNSTVGFGGLVDVATLSGVERQPADFGQTLYVWGIASGPYLVLPILGPSTPRDAIGGGVDSYADPFTILAKNDDVTDLLTYRFVVGGIEERAGVLDVLDDLEKNSVDFYAQLRSLWQQHRDAELRHGKAPETAPGLYDDPGKPAPPPSSATPARKPAAMRPATVHAAKAAAAPPGKAHTPAAHAHHTAAGRRRDAQRHPAAVAKQPRLSRAILCAASRCAGRAA
ncbi:MAG TPA: VacJ family lipoprotein [Stellaceae bacterium]|nr:VacJ family lipoprotein [Stellaceae bacterium]